MLVDGASAVQSRQELTSGEDQMLLILPESEFHSTLRIASSLRKFRQLFFSLILVSLWFGWLLKKSHHFQPKWAQAKPSGGDQELDEDELLLPRDPPQEQVLAAQAHPELKHPELIKQSFEGYNNPLGVPSLTASTSPINCHLKWLRKYTMCNQPI